MRPLGPKRFSNYSKLGFGTILRRETELLGDRGRIAGVIDRIRSNWSIIPPIILDLLVTISFILFSKGIPYFPNGINLRPIDPSKSALDLLISTWSPANLGESAYPQSSILLVYLLQLVVQNEKIVVILIAVAPFWIATLSMWSFLIKTPFVANSVVISVGSIVYTYNWVTFFHTGDLIGIYPFCVAPLVLLFSYKIFERDRGWFWSVVGLALSLVIGTLIYPVIGVIFLLPILISSFLYAMLSRRKFRVTTLLKQLLGHVAALGLYILLLLPFTIYEFTDVLGSGVGGFAASNGFNVLTNYVAYLDPQTFMHYFPFGLSTFLLLTSPLLDNPVRSLAILVAMTGFMSIISSDYRKKSLGISITFMIVIFQFLVLLILDSSNAINILYQKIPLLVAINGFGAYSLVLGMLLGIVLPIGLDSAVCWIRANFREGPMFSTRIEKVAGVIAIVFLIGISLAPVISQNFAIFNVATLGDPPQTGPMSSVESAVIQNLSTYFNELRSQDGPFRVLWLPQSNALNEQLQVYDEISNLQFGAIASKPGLMEEFTNLLNSVNTDNFARILEQLGYKYIVVLQEHTSAPIYIDQSGVDRYLEGGSNNFINLLNNQTNITTVADGAQYTIYENKLLSQANNSVFWESNGNQNITSSSNLTPSQGTVDVINWGPYYAPTSFELYVNSSSPQWLVFADNFDSQWHAIIQYPNGSSYKLTNSEVNGWANGFYIPATAGSIVELTYSGQAFLNGVYIIWIFLLIFLGAAFVWKVLRQKFRLEGIFGTLKSKLRPKTGWIIQTQRTK